MTIETNSKTRSLYTEGDESAWDFEPIVLTSADYTPTSASGASVKCRGFMITGATEIGRAHV